MMDGTAPLSNPGAPTKNPSNSAGDTARPHGFILDSAGRLWLLTALLLSTACDPTIGRTTWILGDSIAAELVDDLSTAEVERERGGVTVALAAVRGATIGEPQGFVAGTSYFTGRLASATEKLSPPQAIVISLGTNDVRRGVPASITTVREIVDALPQVPTIWILPSGPALDVFRAYRQQVYIVLGSSPNVRVYSPPREAYDVDGIHLSESGEVLVAAAVRDLIDLALTPVAGEQR